MEGENEGRKEERQKRRNEDKERGKSCRIRGKEEENGEVRKNSKK